MADGPMSPLLQDGGRSLHRRSRRLSQQIGRYFDGGHRYDRRSCRLHRRFEEPRKCRHNAERRFRLHRLHPFQRLQGIFRRLYFRLGIFGSVSGGETVDRRHIDHHSDRLLQRHGRNIGRAQTSIRHHELHASGNRRSRLQIRRFNASIRWCGVYRQRRFDFRH